MEEEIYEAIKVWAGVFTWHTGHALDEARFQEAIDALREFELDDLRADDIRSALRRHRDENPEVLGGKPSNERLEKYVGKVISALSDARSGL